MNSRQCTQKVIENPHWQNLSAQRIQRLLGGNQTVELKTIWHAKRVARQVNSGAKITGKVVLPP